MSNDLRVAVSQDAVTTLSQELADLDSDLARKDPIGRDVDTLEAQLEDMKVGDGIIQAIWQNFV